MSTGIAETLSFSMIDLAVKQADEESRRQYEDTLAKAVAQYMEQFGVATTLRILLEYEYEKGRGFPFLGKCDIRMPVSHLEVDKSVEDDISRKGSNVHRYIVGELSERDMIGSDCQLRLTDNIAIVIPLWESATAIARNLDRIRHLYNIQVIPDEK